MDAINSLTKSKDDLYAFPNAHINLPIWSFMYVFIGTVIYYFYRQGNDAITPILVMIFIMYGLWDAFPVMVIQNGYKYMHLWLFDTMITGGCLAVLCCRCGSAALLAAALLAALALMVAAAAAAAAAAAHAAATKLAHWR